MNAQDLAIYRAIIQSQTATHYDIAKAIYIMYSNVMTCQQIIRGGKRTVVWYERAKPEDNWKEMQESKIRTLLSNEVAKRYVKTTKFLFEKSIQNDEIVKMHWIDVATKLIKVYGMLGNNSTKNAIIREMVDLFDVKK
jgi:hypothetical protein